MSNPKATSNVSKRSGILPNDGKASEKMELLSKPLTNGLGFCVGWTISSGLSVTLADAAVARVATAGRRACFAGRILHWPTTFGWHLIGWHTGLSERRGMEDMEQFIWTLIVGVPGCGSECGRLKEFKFV